MLLRADFERWPRWMLGLGGYAAAVVGTFVLFGMIEAIRLLGGPLQAFDLLIVAGAGVVCLVGCATLVALWWTGRKLSRAAAWWLRLPYVSSNRERRAGGWLSARIVNFEPRVFTRLVSGTIALLIGIAAVSLLMRDLLAGATAMALATAVIALVSLAAGSGQIGGMLRLVAALGEADPLWWRIRSALGRTRVR